MENEMDLDDTYRMRRHDPDEERRRNAPSGIAAYAAFVSAAMIAGGALVGYVIARIVTAALDTIIEGLESADAVASMGQATATVALSSAALSAALSAAVAFVTAKRLAMDGKNMTEEALAAIIVTSSVISVVVMVATNSAAA